MYHPNFDLDRNGTKVSIKSHGAKGSQESCGLVPGRSDCLVCRVVDRGLTRSQPVKSIAHTPRSRTRTGKLTKAVKFNCTGLSLTHVSMRIWVLLAPGEEPGTEQNGSVKVLKIRTAVHPFSNCSNNFSLFWNKNCFLTVTIWRRKEYVLLPFLFFNFWY